MADQLNTTALGALTCNIASSVAEFKARATIGVHLRLAADAVRVWVNEAPRARRDVNGTNTIHNRAIL